MRPLADMNMRSKLLLLMFLPYLMLAIFATKSIIDNYSEWQDIQQEDALSDLIIKLDDLAGATLQEKNASKIYLNNKEGGIGNLTDIRSYTDGAITRLKEFVENRNFFFASLSKQNYHKILEQLELLNQKREKINTLSISIAEVNLYFEDIMKSLSQEIAEIAHNDSNLTISRTIYAYLGIAQEGYAAQIEKQILTDAFQANALTPEALASLQTIINQQEIYHDMFLQQSSQEQKELFRGIVKDEVVNEVNKMRSSFIEKGLSGNFGANLQTWRQVQETKISLLKAIKDKLLLTIDKTGDALILSAKENLFIVASAFTFVTILTAVLTALIVKNITNPLISTVRLAENVSDGNLKIEGEISDRKDELGLLQKALYKMRENLQTMAHKMQREIEILANSTGKIAISISEVSSTTAETASAVTETTATVEELKQTAHVSVEKASDVMLSSEEAIKTLKMSEKALNTTIEDMRHIQEKMNIISESIVKLSEHSQTIGEIIDTVNDLADQSNLLAVNAAIEAAKAGDQGKGFSVVAQEVRSLAEQSKQATVQVRGILKDIQNATSAAVMATEQGAKAVTKGVLQSSQTSESIRVLSEGIGKVAQTAEQISLSSQQQLIGVDQVTVAMSNIKEASNQHVDYMQTIKEKMYDLNAVGQALKNFAEQYKL